MFLEKLEIQILGCNALLLTILANQCLTSGRAIPPCGPLLRAFFPPQPGHLGCVRAGPRGSWRSRERQRQQQKPPPPSHRLSILQRGPGHPRHDPIHAANNLGRLEPWLCPFYRGPNWVTEHLGNLAKVTEPWKWRELPLNPGVCGCKICNRDMEAVG